MGSAGFFAILVCTVISCSNHGDGEKSSAEKRKNAPEHTSGQETPATPRMTQAAALNPESVPIAALREFEAMPLRSRPPCSDTIESLRPILNDAAATRKQLSTVHSTENAATLLTNLAASMRTKRLRLATRTETSELQRISAELNAALGDLAESLQLAADALTANDQEAATKLTLRIENGVSNTRTSIERLIEECAS